jgi:hypothetical protein
VARPKACDGRGMKALSLGGTGYTFRLSLNSNTQAIPNRIGFNSTDNADPLAGTDPTLQATVYDELRVGTTWADVTPGLPGDYNGNGVVDAADYVL